MRDNPFTPTFGTLPTVLVGREHVVAGIRPLLGAFAKNDVHWATHLCAHRGAGKTVLLDQIQDIAAELGWWVIQEDAGSGQSLTSRLINRALTRLAEHDPPRRRRRVANVSAFGASVGLEAEPPAAPSVTSVRDVLAALAEAEQNGLLVTVDEVHQAPDRALNELGNAVQHLHRDGLPFVLVMAGLPRRSRTKEPTFLGRAWRPPLARLSDREVENGLVATAAAAGGSFVPLALRRAVELSAGEPFLMQLVGFHAWDAARRSRITDRDVDAAGLPARSAFNRAVTAQMVGDVSPDQRSFLASMVRHGTPTPMVDVRNDNGWSSSQAGVYRQRLLEAGLITAPERGVVDFALPGVADVLADEV